MLTTTLLLLTLGQAASPAKASSLILSAPTAVAALDFGKLKGEPFRLAWSPDGSELYLQTVERDSIGNIKSARHYIVKIGEKSLKGVDGEPAWAPQYWAWKSGQAAPGVPSLKIDIEQKQETRRTTATPMGGDLARGGTGSGAGRGGGATSIGDVTAAAAQSQTVQVIVLRLRGERIGEWVNSPVVPGLTFGWAPEGSALIAFADPDGRLVLMDQTGDKQKVSETDDVVLPAWSGDAKRLAWIERDGRKKGTIRIAEVGQGS